MNYGLASTGVGGPLVGVPAMIISAQQGLSMLVILFAVLALWSLIPRRKKHLRTRVSSAKA